MKGSSRSVCCFGPISFPISLFCIKKQGRSARVGRQPRIQHDCTGYTDQLEPSRGRSWRPPAPSTHVVRGMCQSGVLSWREWRSHEQMHKAGSVDCVV